MPKGASTTPDWIVSAGLDLGPLVEGIKQAHKLLDKLAKKISTVQAAAGSVAGRLNPQLPNAQQVTNAANLATALQNIATHGLTAAAALGQVGANAATATAALTNAVVQAQHMAAAAQQVATSVAQVQQRTGGGAGFADRYDDIVAKGERRRGSAPNRAAELRAEAAAQRELGDAVYRNQRQQGQAAPAAQAAAAAYVEAERKAREAARVGAGQRPWDMLVKGAKTFNVALWGQEQGLTRVIQKVGSWLTATSAVFAVMRGIQSSIRDIIAIDFEKASIAKLYNPQGKRVTAAEATRAAEWATEGAAQIAAVWGETVPEIQRHIQGWIRQQMDVSEAIGFTELSLRLQKATSMDAAAAQSVLTSNVKEYELSLSQAALQVDSLNALENTGAVKAEEIARGVGLAGLAAKQAGMEIETLNAIIAKTIEVTQLSGSQVGRGWRMIINRTYGDLGRKALAEQNIPVTMKGTDLKNQRDMWQILTDVAAKWDTLTTSEQKHLMTAMAGQRQQQFFQAAMDNWSGVLDAVQKQWEGVNSAALEAARMQDTITGRLKLLQATWQGVLAQQSGGIGANYKNLIDWATEKIKKFNEMDPERVRAFFQNWAVGLTLVIGLVKTFVAAAAFLMDPEPVSKVALLAAALGNLAAVIGVAWGTSKLFGAGLRDQNALLAKTADALSLVEEKSAALSKLQGTEEGIALKAQFAEKRIRALATARMSQNEKDEEARKIMRALIPDIKTASDAELERGMASERTASMAVRGLNLQKGSLQEMQKAAHNLRLMEAANAKLHKAELEVELKLRHDKLREMKNELLLQAVLIQGQITAAKVALAVTLANPPHRFSAPSTSGIAGGASRDLGVDTAGLARIKAEVETYIAEMEEEQAELRKKLGSTDVRLHLLDAVSSYPGIAEHGGVGGEWDREGDEGQARAPRRAPTLQVKPGELDKVLGGELVTLDAGELEVTPELQQMLITIAARMMAEAIDRAARLGPTHTEVGPAVKGVLDARSEAVKNLADLAALEAGPHSSEDNFRQVDGAWAKLAQRTKNSIALANGLLRALSGEDLQQWRAMALRDAEGERLLKAAQELGGFILQQDNGQSVPMLDPRLFAPAADSDQAIGAPQPTALARPGAAGKTPVLRPAPVSATTHGFRTRAERVQRIMTGPVGQQAWGVVRDLMGRRKTLQGKLEDLARLTEGEPTKELAERIEAGVFELAPEVEALSKDFARDGYGDAMTGMGQWLKSIAGYALRMYARVAEGVSADLDLQEAVRIREDVQASREEMDRTLGSYATARIAHWSTWLSDESTAASLERQIQANEEAQAGLKGDLGGLLEGPAREEFTQKMAQLRRALSGLLLEVAKRDADLALEEIARHQQEAVERLDELTSGQPALHRLAGMTQITGETLVSVKVEMARAESRVKAAQAALSGAQGEDALAAREALEAAVENRQRVQEALERATKEERQATAAQRLALGEALGTIAERAAEGRRAALETMAEREAEARRAAEERLAAARERNRRSAEELARGRFELGLMGDSAEEAQQARRRYETEAEVRESRRVFDEETRKGVPYRTAAAVEEQAQAERAILEKSNQEVLRDYQERFLSQRDLYRGFLSDVMHDTRSFVSAFKKLAEQIAGTALDRMIASWKPLRGWLNSVAGTTTRGQYGMLEGWLAGVNRGAQAGFGMKAQGAGEPVLGGYDPMFGELAPVMIPTAANKGQVILGQKQQPSAVGKDFAKSGGGVNVPLVGGYKFPRLGGQNLLPQVLTGLNIGLDSLQHGTTLGSLLSHSLQGLAVAGPIGAGIGAGIDLLGGLFKGIGGLFGGHERQMRGPVEQLNLPTSADMRFAAPSLGPESAWFGGRAGSNVTDNRQVTITATFPGVTTREQAESVAAGLAAGTSPGVTSLRVELSRRGSGQYG